MVRQHVTVEGVEPNPDFDRPLLVADACEGA